MASADRPHSLQAASEAPEPRDARRRRELIEATIASIARNGLSGTTIAKVAEIANLSAGIVSFYFRTKEALLLETLEHLDREFEDRRREVLDRAGDDPIRRLEAFIDVNLDPALCDATRVAVWVAFWGESQARESYQRVCGARDVSEEEQLVALFEQIAARRDGDHIDPRALGLAFYHLVSSLPEAVLDHGRAFDYEQAKQICRNFLASVFPAEFSSDAIARRDPTDSVDATKAAAAPLHETLPAWVYRSPEFYELEREHIFKRNWLMVGHVSEVPNPGDYITLDAVGERALVIRDGDGALRAFHNVCRHRASRVVTGASGNCGGSMVCPYHAWSYGFDGKLRAVPSENTFSDLDKDRMGLLEAELEQWMGILFVRFAGDGPSVESMMEEFEGEARHYRIEEMKPWGRRTELTEDFNWKFFCENDAEGYHVPKGHPGLRRMFGASYADEQSNSQSARSFGKLQDKASTHWAERSYQRLLPEVAHLPEELRRAWIYYGFNPGFGIQLTPDLVDCYQVLPLGPDRCRIVDISLALDDDRREMRAARYLNQRITRQITQEDVDFCYWTDGGLRTSGYPGGVLSELEFGVRDFQNWIRETLPVAKRAEEPATGAVSALNDGMRDGH
ncbi:MAG: Rieske 2Fe-2S domain-containing protein [Deltaproteobacteria bacterium]|jgi:phenylpropionate dioxygenase-like ring-hydroxylating dioxygenase large terminal subunit/DNA-binding transcriptional regulator YbjK|nr:Rieske 2Fe-2S domain-containing protein [Deltaproteobacteria bacterium]